MIPQYIQEYLYDLDFVHIKNDLLGKGAGAFAFYTMFVDTTDSQGQKRTMDWAMRQAVGNKELAKGLMRMPDDKSFGFAYVRQDGKIDQYQFFCDLVQRGAKSLDALIQGLQRQGIKVDPQKLCDPAWMYRTVYE